ncbi:MAG: hypothetical protein EPN49_04010 [Rhodanobacter sp.]|nr:MAG: hypothetical protein EPN49_04010 [Rhodanobacter sp.]
MREIFRKLPEFDYDFLEQIESEYRLSVGVENIGAWLDRFGQLAEAVARGAGTYRQVEDHLFELKVIRFLEVVCRSTEIAYEPTGIEPRAEKCDLTATYRSDRYLVEMKCFHPNWRDTRIPVERIAAGNKVIMNGPVYHQYQATRGHLIDRVFETERKFANYSAGAQKVLAVPVGFHLNLEDLRDFIFIYRNGRPRADDPLGPMTLHNMPRPFSGTIDHFWALPFMQESFSFAPHATPTLVAPEIANDRTITA